MEYERLKYFETTSMLNLPSLKLNLSFFKGFMEEDTIGVVEL